MCTYKERLKEIYKKKNNKGSFVEKMSTMDEELRKWVAADLHDITKASLWTILYNWGNGRSQPLKLQQEAIAQYFESTCEELFPSK